MQRYFDYYCKGIDNGFKQDTPKVRMSLLAFDSKDVQDVVEKPAKDWPIPGTTYQTLYLDANRRELSQSPLETISSASYIAHDFEGELVSMVGVSLFLNAASDCISHLP